MPRGWRVTKAHRAANALDGEGVRLHGGRWNSPGSAIAYTAQSESLAALELLVHLQASHLLMEYCSISVDFDEGLVEAVGAGALPPDWRNQPAPTSLQQIGDQWAAERRSVVLRVPSALVPNEAAFLLNPRHADFGRVVIGRPNAFHFDTRLK